MFVSFILGWNVTGALLNCSLILAASVMEQLSIVMHFLTQFSHQDQETQTSFVGQIVSVF